MFSIYVSDLAITVQRGSLPSIYNDLKRHARLAEEFALRPHEGELCYLSVSSSGHWPFLVVAQRFELSEGGFDPGAMIVPETKLLFIGAGRRLLSYALDGPRRLWEDTADSGFLEWSRDGDVVLMSAELELAAWDTMGHKLWSMPLEPAWEYHVSGGQVHLDVLGRKSSFPLRAGPGQAAPE